MVVSAEWLDLPTGRTRLLHVRGTGDPILLLHGYSDSATTWTGVLRRLAARGRTAYALDLPGFGRAAPRPPGPRWRSR